MKFHWNYGEILYHPYNCAYQDNVYISFAFSVLFFGATKYKYQTEDHKAGREYVYVDSGHIEESTHCSQ